MISASRTPSRIAFLVFAALIFIGGPVADAQSSVDGPTVSLDRTTLMPGERVLVTIVGFNASAVTISVCGNEARRGSSDCNMYASRALELNGVDSPTVAQLPVEAPRADCPCVIRVSSRTSDEVAATPITLTGHPVGPVVAPPVLDNPLSVTISARAAPVGLLERVRPNLGGPVAYEVTVTVHNKSTVPLQQVSVTGSVGRNAHDQLATLELDNPGEIGPGQTWKQVVSAVVPAPSLGTVQWRVAVSGAGPTISAIDSTRHRPVLLVVLAMLFVVDLSVLAVRGRVRRRAARDAELPS